MLHRTSNHLCAGTTPRPSWRWARGLAGFLAGLLVAALACRSSSAGTQDEIDWFEQRVRPLLVRHCFECHSKDTEEPAGGLLLDRRAGVLQGGELGPAVVVGEPDKSLLIRAVGYRDTGLQMPPSGKLPERDIGILTEWVRRGAAFPEQGPAVGPKRAGIDIEAGKKFWSFQPLRSSVQTDSKDAISPPALPPGSGFEAWPQQRLDRYVVHAMQVQGLTPSPPADRRTLIRRLNFDLLGLPPTPDEVDAFERDETPEAYARLVDRLLASPHYGQRWGRHWLDVARYTDATASWLQSTGQAWLYRDWVVRSLNQDLGYDQFVRRQLATDLLDETGPEDHAALGFLGLSPTYWKELKLAPDVIKTVVAEEWEERIDAVSRSFLGLTVACARCHDHKFDPITQRDYYALAGVFASTRLIDRPLLPADQAERVAQARRVVAELDQKIKQTRDDLQKEVAKQQAAPPNAAEAAPPPTTVAAPPSVAEGESPVAALRRQLAEQQRQREQVVRDTPNYDMPLAHGVDEARLLVLPQGPDQTRLEYQPGQAQNVSLQIRGNPATPGPEVPRRFLAVLSEETPPEFQHGSGRRELADSLFREARALAARVIVNRVWSWHFGRGIVATPSNFGMQGARPTHPELLDDLAVRFIENDWSLKWLHREILLSATYQQSSAHDPRRAELDPENRWLSRMNRRRLEIEPWRDSVLAVSRDLDSRLDGPAEELTGASRRRTLYGKVQRRDLDALLQLYDFPQPESHSPGRTPTTTPLQQLFVLNSPFFRVQSERLAASILATLPSDASIEGKLDRLYQRLFQRLPTESETRLARQFLGEVDQAGDSAPDSAATRWTDYIHVLLGSNEFMFVD